MHKVSGGCHCGNILVDLELTAAPGTYHPRACDCEFCLKHAAAYVSEPNGSLLIRIKNPRASGTYRQGSGLAEFLLCRNCGVLVGALHRINRRLYAAVNVRVIDGAAKFGAEQTVSPQKLSGDEKVRRWQDVWFSNVEVRGHRIEFGGSSMEHEQVSDTWERASPYEQYVGRWSRRVAPLFLSWLGIPAGRKWLDVGCGTGALCTAIVDRCSPSSVIGIEPSEGFLNIAKQNLADRVALHQGSATAIPLGDASVDVVVSGLVLNFVQDQRAALAEMARVTSKGGTIAAYVWDYAGKMELMRFFWDAAVELDPNAATMDEGVRFPLCRPQALENLFADAGLKGIDVTSFDIPTPFANFDDYWQPFLGGQGPAPAYAMSLDETARARLRDRIRELVPIEANGSISLTARAWATRATVAE